MLSIQIPATLIRETDRAILVELVGSQRRLWVPKSIGRIQKVVEVKYHPATALPAEFRKPDATALCVPQWWWQRAGR